MKQSVRQPVHIVSYNLDPKKFSKSKIHTLPNYEQTDLKMATIVTSVVMLPEVASVDGAVGIEQDALTMSLTGQEFAIIL